MASAKALIGAVAGRFLFRHGAVTRVTPLGQRYRRIDVTGAELAGASFVPGDKVQVYFAGVGMRTYTPVTWSAEGATWFVGFAHGDTPGATWVRTVKQGDEVALFGPRRSLDVSALTQPLVVVGDETSLAVACALSRTHAVTAVLEAGDVEELREVGAALELRGLTVVPRGALEPAVRAQLAAGAVPVFTGRAASIQALKRSLGDLARTGKTKAYWADGKRGLD
jgi:NADPH-dependent ferric siderophore reductase